MDLLQLKKDLLHGCSELMKERAEALEKVMEEAQQSANDYGQPKDRYDSYRAQLLRKRDMFGQQLQKIIHQRNLLDMISTDKEMDKVGFGCLVITDKQKIFVSIGIGKFVFNNEDYFVISAAVPFYKAMEGKGRGESFQFRGQTHMIKEIV